MTGRGAIAAAVALVLAGGSLGAQVRARPPVRVDTLARRDTLLRDKEIIIWAQPDSVMAALLSRPGYVATRYQGDTVVFRALERILRLVRGDSARAGVEREKATLVGDSLLFNDSTKIVTAWGDTLILRDPTQGPDDLIARGRMAYDVANRRGMVTNVTTSVESGQIWVVHGNRAAFVNDTSAAARNRLYAKDGWITSCTETEPHYHFASKEMKVVSGRLLVARPAVLYIADVPVIWLPFVFADLRRGRHSGVVTPRVGFSDVIRNSPTYRRTIENLGYYFVLNDYLDAELTMDWRSDANSPENDPGWIKGNSIFRYSWLNRFMNGDVGYSYHALSNGDRNQQVTWNHRQSYSQRSQLNLSFNWAENTKVQRQATFNPYVALGTIASRGTFNTARGPFTFNFGAGQRQYPGRETIDREFPSLNVTAKPIEVGEWLTWTPSFSYTGAQRLHDDAPSDFSFAYTQTPTGIDSVALDKNLSTTNMQFNTPLEIFGFQLQNSFTLSDQLNDFPSKREIYDINTGALIDTRVFARTYATSVDWNTSFSLPAFLQGTWNFSPTVNMSNVDAGGFFVRTERTGGKWVRQSKRLSYGAAVSPTVYRILPGFGPIDAIRHQIQFQSSYRYSPSAQVSDEFLQALGRTRKGYLGSLPQNAVTFGFNTNFEAKLRARVTDTTNMLAPEGRKMKLLSLNFSSLEWDFERAKATGGTGLTTESFGIGATTDLLPGFDFSMDYSLFQGSTISDTAKFKPFRTGLSASLQLNAKSPILVGLARMLGIRMDTTTREGAQVQRGPTTESGYNEASRYAADQPFRGSVNRAAPVDAIPAGRGWQASLRYSSNRQRPVSGSTVVDFNPQSRCEQYRLTNAALYNQCLLEVGATQPTDPGFINTPPGATIFRVPPTENLQASMQFHITEKWGAQWSTTYDFVEKDFASHVVSLQRELHDWDAVFAFTRSPNGNFAFNFFISLKAQPDIKFDYNRNTLPRGITGQPQQ